MFILFLQLFIIQLSHDSPILKSFFKILFSYLGCLSKNIAWRKNIIYWVLSQPLPGLNLLATSSHLFLTIHFVGSFFSFFFFLPFLERKTNSPSPFLKLRVGCCQVQNEGWDFINSREIQVKRKKKNKNTLNFLQDHHCWDIILWVSSEQKQRPYKIFSDYLFKTFDS